MSKHDSAKMPWKILNQTDKLYGKVTTRHMTEEERQKYGEASQIQRLNLGADEYMKKLNITTEELLKDCKEFGTSWEACKLIGNRHNLTQKQVYNLVLGRKIKEKLVLPEELDVETLEETKPEAEELKMPELSKGIAINFAELKEYKPRLRPKTLLSQTVCGLEYKLRDECLLIHADINVDLEIAWGSLDDFIKDLQEVKEIAAE